MQLDIVQVATSLARDTKTLASVSIIGAVTDVMRHLRKSIHYSLDDANLGADLIKWNRQFREAVDDCLIELSSKVSLSSMSGQNYTLMFELMKVKYQRYHHKFMAYAYISLLSLTYTYACRLCLLFTES